MLKVMRVGKNYKREVVGCERRDRSEVGGGWGCRLLGKVLEVWYG